MIPLDERMNGEFEQRMRELLCKEFRAGRMPTWDRLSGKVGLLSERFHSLRNQPRDLAASFEAELQQLIAQGWKVNPAKKHDDDHPNTCRERGRQLRQGNE